MNRPLKHFNMHASLSPALGLAAVNPKRSPRTSAQLPRRPSLTVLSEAIPLFYVGQNRRGLWVVREAEGRSGGIFVCKESALRFAREKSEPAGCATMLVPEPFELDIANDGGRLVAPLAVAMEALTRRAPRLSAVVGTLVMEWRRLVAEISHALAAQRRHRAAIEHELFHDQIWLGSKSDDDLPMFG